MSLTTTPDTNILVRAFVEEDPVASITARVALDEAGDLALTLPMLCELVWVLRRGYRIPPIDIATLIRRLVKADGTACDRGAVDAGLAMMDAGGDFADAVIAYEGIRLGGEVFLTFDRRASRRLTSAGVATRLLAAQ